ncbi:hypothetical protein D0469_03050 [Peribacillus saganii]|uniref:GNAT family N-acetyltransferase n=1 Tax=Peribacillus saganii TaxID=2303992 RepID=A0A372LRY2_9BACI|nr:hypothetical protein [Peribacillus saganii]RFU70941.1 hypothetical protein D0469_03050 [Peribacillus saganii]
MQLEIRRTKLSEADTLLQIQKEAFQNSLVKYRDYHSSPATEPLDVFKESIRFSYHYTIFFKKEIIGGIIIKRLTDFHLFLDGQ